MIAPLKYIKTDNEFYIGNVPPERLKYWNHMQTMRKMNWNENETKNLPDDIVEYVKYSAELRSLIDAPLTFFAQFDGIINESIMSNIIDIIKSIYIKNCYIVQMERELVHQIMYAELLEGIITNKKHRVKLINALYEMDSLSNLCKWLERNTVITKDNKKSFAKVLLINVMIEGVLFASMFAIIDYLSKKGMMKVLTTINGWISKDEETHVVTGIYVNSDIEPECQLTFAEFKAIVTELLEIFREVVKELVPHEYDIISAKSLCKYMDYLTDVIATRYEYGEKIFYTENPFDFVKYGSFTGTNNNFEVTSTDYQHEFTKDTTMDDDYINIKSDF